MRTHIHMGLLALLVAASLGCGTRGPSQGPEGGGDVVANDKVASDEVIVYRVGNPAGEGGQSELRLSSTGEATVENRQGGAPPSRFEGQVPADTLATLVRKVDAADLWSVRKRATAVPDEAPVMIELRRGDGTVQSVALWQNQLRDTPELLAVKDELARLIREVSGGKVY